VVGVDVSHPLVEMARTRGRAANPVVEFVEADASAATIPGAPFDAAFSRFGVMFFHDPVSAFGRIRQALRPSAARRSRCAAPHDRFTVPGWVGI
jgi:ubiquinone/menaquinone biosynthesis C-methylase UbiE